MGGEKLRAESEKNGTIGQVSGYIKALGEEREGRAELFRRAATLLLMAAVLLAGRILSRIC